MSIKILVFIAQLNKSAVVDLARLDFKQLCFVFDFFTWHRL